MNFRIAFLVSILTGISFIATAQKGKLFIIGGGERSDALIGDMVNSSGLTGSDYIIVLPMASVQPDTGFYYISRQIAKHSTAPIRMFDFRKEGIDRKTWEDSVRAAKLIYILGGDQNSFMNSVRQTDLYGAIHDAYNSGATIAGTSAGAAVMSRRMITGQMIKDTVYKETFDKLLKDNIAFADGLGLLQDVIIDQHFVRRSRYNRLLSAIADMPGYTGIGIDEGTALVVEGKKARVSGESQVIRFRHAARNNKTGGELINLKKIRIDLFINGENFRL